MFTCDPFPLPRNRDNNCTTHRLAIRIKWNEDEIPSVGCNYYSEFTDEEKSQRLRALCNISQLASNGVKNR